MTNDNTEKSEQQPQRQNMLPALLSLLFPGLGQLVQGRKIFALYAFLYVLTLFILYSICVGGVGRWMLNSYDFFRINFYALLVFFPFWAILLSVLDAVAWKKDQPSLRGSRFVKLGIGSVFVVMLTFFLLFATSLGDYLRRIQCITNLMNIVQAMHCYYEDHKCFPPAYTVDENGVPLHSWRVLILPYFVPDSTKYKTLYEKIRLNEPWDSEYNQQFHDVNIPFYSCPVAVRSSVIRRILPNMKSIGMSHYSVVIGQETPFPGSETTTLCDITSGTQNTLLVVERPFPVNWMDPNNEIRFENAIVGINRSPYGIGSFHSGGAMVAQGCGWAWFVSDSIDPATLRTWLTKSGGEKVEIP